MHRVAEKLAAMRWAYGDGDPSALAELHRRVAEAGRKGKLLTYSQLLRGVTFQLANVAGGAPFDIDLAEGRELDRAILGSFLGRMCADSYLEGRFMASALVVTEAEREPGPGFGRLMVEIGAVRSSRPRVVYDFWVSEVAKAHEWYQSSRP